MLIFLIVPSTWAFDFSWSKKPQVLTAQSGRTPEERTPAQSSFLNIPTNRKTILRYDFTVKASNNKNSTIECTATIPKSTKPQFLSIAGIQAFENPVTGKEPAFTTYEENDNYFFKFFLPQNNNSTGYIEFSVEPSIDLTGKSAHVFFEYRRFKKKLPNILNIFDKYRPIVVNCVPPMKPRDFNEYGLNYESEKLDGSFVHFILKITN